MRTTWYMNVYIIQVHIHDIRLCYAYSILSSGRCKLCALIIYLLPPAERKVAEYFRALFSSIDISPVPGKTRTDLTEDFDFPVVACTEVVAAAVAAVTAEVVDAAASGGTTSDDDDGAGNDGGNDEGATALATTAVVALAGRAAAVEEAAEAEVEEEEETEEETEGGEEDDDDDDEGEEEETNDGIGPLGRGGGAPAGAPREGGGCGGY